MPVILHDGKYHVSHTRLDLLMKDAKVLDSILDNFAWMTRYFNFYILYVPFPSTGWRIKA